MSILTVGGDLRYAHMTRLAAAQSMEIAAVGLENCPFSLPCAPPEAIVRADVLILPNPFRTGPVLPYAARPIGLSDIAAAAGRGAVLLLSDTAALPEDLPGNNLIDLSQDPVYALYNAHLTAEGAAAAAAQASERALMGSMCLVIGYGKIGRRLSMLLHAMGADTAAAARSEPARALIRTDGISAFSMNDLPALLPRADFIFSTPPACVLPEPLLRLIRPDAHLMDLASPPYGFDLALAKSLSLNAVRENGLPGRYCPLSAGTALLAAVSRALCIHMKEEYHARQRHKA